MQHDLLDAEIQRADTPAPQTRDMRAIEFCDDLAPGTVLSDGASHNAGVRRLLESGSYDELSTGITEFVRDRYSQHEILVLLKAHLSIPIPSTFPELHAQHYTQRRLAAIRTPSNHLHRALAQSIRFHRADLCIVQLVCDIFGMLELMNHSSPGGISIQVPNDLCDDITETMLGVIQEHQQDSVFVRNCLKAVYTVTKKHFPQIVGDHIVLNVLSQMLHLHRNDLTIVMYAEWLLSRFLVALFAKSTTVLIRRQVVHAINVEQTEDDIMYIIQENITTNSNVVVNCLGCITLLYRVVFTRMRHHAQTSEFIMSALLGNNTDGNGLVLACIDTLIAILPNYWEQSCVPADRRYHPTAKTLFPATKIIPILSFAVLSQSITPNNTLQQHSCKTVCYRFLTLLYLLCQNHAEHKKWVITHKVVHFLEETFSTAENNSIDARWSSECNRLKTLLLV